MKLLNTVVNNANDSKKLIFVVDVVSEMQTWDFPTSLQNGNPEFEPTTQMFYRTFWVGLMNAHKKWWCYLIHDLMLRTMCIKFISLVFPNARRNQFFLDVVVVIVDGNVIRIVFANEWRTKFDDYDAKRDVYQFSKLFYQRHKHTYNICKHGR